MTIQGCNQTLVNHPNNPKKVKSSLKSTLTALLATSGPNRMKKLITSLFAYGCLLALAPQASYSLTLGSATPSISNGEIVDILITNGGSGMTSVPTVSIVDDGGGTGAQATATVSGGVVTSVSVTNGGTGYTAATKVYFLPSGDDLGDTPADSTDTPPTTTVDTGTKPGETPTQTSNSELINLTPVVENVTAAQVDGTKHLEVFFDLTVADNHPCQITVKWSTDNGETYPLTAVAVTGDAGPGIAPGTGKKVIWDMGVDWDNQFTQTGRIQIIASREPIDMSTGDNSQTGDTSPTDPQ
jgi:hypothetical protein